MQPPEKHLNNARKILAFIKREDNFLLSAHINADGDAIASVIAVHILLKKLKKHSVMVLHDPKPDHRFKYLKYFENIQHCSDSPDWMQMFKGGKPQCAVILDVPGHKRLGDVSTFLPPENKIIKIDHHPVEDIMGHIDWVDENTSSTTAMVYEIVELADVEIDIGMARAIFTGIIYDTGRFSFSNTRSRDLAICSKMIDIGVKPEEITNRIFFENSFKALKTIGKGLYSLENHLDGAVNIIYLGLEEMSRNNQSEIEELANYSVAIRGGEVGLFIREIKPDFHKISFRSKGKVDVNKVAKAFNGGGHARASGCRIDGKKDEIIPAVLAQIKMQLQ